MAYNQLLSEPKRQVGCVFPAPRLAALGLAHRPPGLARRAAPGDAHLLGAQDPTRRGQPDGRGGRAGEREMGQEKTRRTHASALLCQCVESELTQQKGL